MQLLKVGDDHELAAALVEVRAAELAPVVGERVLEGHLVVDAGRGGHGRRHRRYLERQEGLLDQRPRELLGHAARSGARREGAGRGRLRGPAGIDGDPLVAGLQEPDHVRAVPQVLVGPKGRPGPPEVQRQERVRRDEQDDRQDDPLHRPGFAVLALLCHSVCYAKGSTAAKATRVFACCQRPPRFLGSPNRK